MRRLHDGSSYSGIQPTWPNGSQARKTELWFKRGSMLLAVMTVLQRWSPHRNGLISTLEAERFRSKMLTAA